jgi:hypothetical protein
MVECSHPSHRAHVTVMHPDADNPGFRAKIEIACNVCRVPFKIGPTGDAALVLEIEIEPQENAP